MKVIPVLRYVAKFLPHIGLLAETFHQAGIVPLMVWGAYRWKWVARDTGSGWVTLALAVSWVADWAGHVHATWPMGAIYPVLQFGILYAVLASPRQALLATLVVGVFGVWAATSVPGDVPSAALTIVGSALLLGLIAGRSDLGLIQPALYVYFGAGTLLKAWFPALLPHPRAFLVLWLGYQGCRMLGLGLVTRSIIHGQQVRSA